MSEDYASVGQSSTDSTEQRADETGGADGGAASGAHATGSDVSATTNGENGPSVETLVTRIAAHDEALAETAHQLGDRIETLEAERNAQREEIETLTEKLTRARADFENYKKRTKKQQEEREKRATEDLVKRLTGVRDNLVRALDQDEDTDIRPGIESTLEEFDRVLEAENVSFITPDAGDEVDPERHEVMLRVESEQPAGTIVDVYQPGYEMAGKVIQPAQVTVSDDD